MRFPSNTGNRRRGRHTLFIILLVVAFVAAACGDTEEPSTSTAAPPTTGVAPPSEPTGAEPEPREFDPALADELTALEAANDGQWTPESAVAAFTAIQPAITAGADGAPPIDLNRLFFFLVENYDSFGAEERSALQAFVPGGVNAVQASLLVADDEVTETYQRFAEQAEANFAELTGHAFPGTIKVIASDRGYFDFGAAGAYTNGANFAAIEGAIGAEAVAEMNALVPDGALLCVIIFGTQFRARPAQRQTAGVMHEVTHCHQHAIHPGGPDAFYEDRTQWMDEGYASWAGEITVGAGGTRVSTPWWDEYHRGRSSDGGYDTLSADYDAIALFSYLHDHGADGWANFVGWFGGLRANSVPDDLKFTNLFEAIPEEAQAGWAAGSLQRLALSDLWTYTTGPGVNASGGVRQPVREALRPDTTVGPYSVGPGGQATVEVAVDLAGEEAALLTLSVQGPGAVHWPWDEDELSTNTNPVDATWCIGPECVCDDGTELGPPAPEFTEGNSFYVALNSGSGFTATLASIEDECSEPTTTVPGFGACPSGEWVANPEDTADLLLTLYESVGVSRPTYVSGPITLSLFEDGAFRFDYNDTTFDTVVDGTPARFVLNNGSFGTWEATESELTVAIDGLDQTLTLVVGGVQQTFETPPGTGGGTAPYRCEGDSLLIDFEISPLWPFPSEWSPLES